MPNLFVVNDEPDIAALATSLLRARTSAANRTLAIDALRRANPTLDFERLKPGAVVVVPDLPGARVAAASDPVGEVADDLVGRVRDGLADLVRAAAQSERARRVDQKAVLELFDTDIVRRLTDSNGQVRENVSSVRAALEEDGADAEHQLGELKAAADDWASDLDALRGLSS